MSSLSAEILLTAGCSAPSHETWATTPISAHLPDLHFSLRNDLDAPVTEADYRGNRVLLYFGYTGCGTQCPVTLARLGRLSKGEKRIRVLFVTVTPALDQPNILHAYLGQYGSDLRGLTGSTSDVETLARRYRVAFPAGSGPNLPHSNLVYVFDQAGHARFLIRPDDSDRAILHDLSRLE